MGNGRLEGVDDMGDKANIGLWVLQVLLAALFLFAGGMKLIGGPEVEAMFGLLPGGSFLQYLTGILEVAGAIGLLIPRLAGLAGLGLAAVMVGAILSHLFFLPPPASQAFGALVILLLSLVVAWGRRERTTALLATR
ncbi:DoxX family protein [Pseudonocardiaceae bacterium YIM PH 21723]|nr:DoxX family protein [Pseudonocardiaceae bacterium YIM PH 21723]